MGPPREILQQGNRIVFLYSAGGVAIADPQPYYRVIRVDRPHDQERVLDQMWLGDGVGKWEGDTLVVDTIGFNDESWLTEEDGYFHSTKMHVVERLTRTGNSMKWEVTVEDPVLLQPWVWEPRTLTRNPDPDAMLREDPPCAEHDADSLFVGF
jgi:hypothetical protein